MRFEVLLERNKSLADASWRPFWIDYKKLKTIIGAEQPSKTRKPMAAIASREQLVASMSKDPVEVAFFTALRHEVDKITSFFAKEQARCETIVAAVLHETERLKAVQALSEEQAAPVIGRLIDAYSALLALENFAVMNYAGCGKILKKKDKLRGFPSKEAYMGNVVDKLEWAAYPRLLKLISAVDDRYRLVLTLVTPAGRDRLLVSRAQSRLSSLSDMKRVASSEKLRTQASGLDAVAAAAAAVSPSSRAATAAAASLRGAAGEQSDSDEGEDDDESDPDADSKTSTAHPTTSTQSSSSSSSSSAAVRAAAAPGLGSVTVAASRPAVSPEEQRRTELDIARFIAGVSHTAPAPTPAPMLPQLGVSMLAIAPPPAVSASSSSSSSAHLSASVPAPAVAPASSSSSSSAAVAVAATAPHSLAPSHSPGVPQPPPSQWAPMSLAMHAVPPVSHAPAPAPVAGRHISAEVVAAVSHRISQAGLNSAYAPLIAVAAEYAPSVPLDTFVLVLSQQPVLASQSPQILAQMALQHAQQAASMNGTRMLPFPQ